MQRETDTGQRTGTNRATFSFDVHVLVAPDDHLCK